MGIKLVDYVELEVGTPQFRIKENINEQNTPSYFFYSQQEMEEGLTGIMQNNIPKKIITSDKVCTVKSGDIIFSLTSGRASIVREKFEGYLLTQNFIRITPQKEIDSKFLIYLLNESGYIKRQLLLGVQGSFVLKYTVSQIRELELRHLPSLKKQKLIGELYFYQLRYEELIKRKARLKKLLMMKKIEMLTD